MTIFPKEKKDKDVLGKAKATIMELFIYYLHESQYKKTHDVQINTNKSIGEIDIVLKNKSEVRIIECKVNPNNCSSLKEEYNKVLTKLQTFEQTEKICEFWFWFPPSDKNIQYLKTNNVSYTILSKRPEDNPLLKGIALSNIKFIMEHII